MEPDGLITLITVGSIVWGGFLVILIRAIFFEKKKSLGE